MVSIIISKVCGEVWWHHAIIVDSALPRDQDLGVTSDDKRLSCSGVTGSPMLTYQRMVSLLSNHLASSSSFDPLHLTMDRIKTLHNEKCDTIQHQRSENIILSFSKIYIFIQKCLDGVQFLPPQHLPSQRPNQHHTSALDHCCMCNKWEE